MTRSIRTRIVLSHMLITLLTVAMIGLLGLVLLLQHGLQREERYLRANAEAIARQIEPYLSLGAPEERVAELARTSAFLIDARVQVLDAAGEALADTGTGRFGEGLIWVGPNSAAVLPRGALEGSSGNAPMGAGGPIVIGIRSEGPLAPELDIEGRVAELLEERIPGTAGGADAVLDEGALFVRFMGSHLDGRIEFHREQLAEEDGVWRSGVEGEERHRIEVEEVLRIEDGQGPHELYIASDGMDLDALAPFLEPGSVAGRKRIGGEGAAGTAAVGDEAGQARADGVHIGGEVPGVVNAVGERASSGSPARSQAGDGHAQPFAARVRMAAGGLHGRSPRGVSVPVGMAESPLGWVEVSQGPSFQGETLAAAARAFGLAALIASVLAGAVGLVFGRGMTAPLARLTEATDRMGAGDLAARAPVDGRDEIAGLARQFNRMAEQLESSFEALEAERDALRHFIADASHELRTPITALKNFNALLQGPAAGDASAREEFLAEGAKQIERLEWMTQHLLDLSRLEAGLIELDREAISVGELVDGALKPLEHRFESRNMRIDLDRLDPDLVLDADGQRLQLVIKNLAENALKYGDEGGRLSIITTSDESGGSSIRVCDDGRGVPEEERETVFERFYRASNAGDEAGDGLGLAIARSIVRAHGGELRCERNADRGACFVICMPPRREMA